MTKLRAVLRRRWLILISGLILGMLAGAFSSVLAPEGDEKVSYRVDQLIVANRASQQRANVEQDALRVARGTIAERAAAALPEDEDSASKVSAAADADSWSIEVSSSDTDPDVATRRVEAYVQSFLDVVNADLLADQEKRMTSLQEQADEAMAALEAFNATNPLLGLVPSPDPVQEASLLAQRLDLEQAADAADALLKDEQLNARATLPYSTLGPDSAVAVDSDLLPVPTGLPFRVALLGLFGFVLAVGLVMIAERLAPRIDTRDELAASVELPVLAEVGYFRHRKIPMAPDGTLRIEGAWAEPYRRIRSAIQFVQADSTEPTRPRVFMFTSPSPSEGKSTTTTVTALALAEAGEQTLVVGGDFRRPSIHKLLGVPAAPGIREHARLDVERPSLDQIVHPTSHEHLYLAPSGAPGKEVVGLADAAKSLITEAVDQGATVLVDTSPVEVANDAIDLLPVVDQVVLVVRSGRTTRKALLSTVERLEQHGASIMGTTLIGTPGLAKQQYYYEGYYAPPAAGRVPPSNGAAPPNSQPPDAVEPVPLSQPVEAGTGRSMVPPPFTGRPADGS